MRLKGDNRISVNGARFQVASKSILHDIDFDVAQDQLVMIVGPSGAGKSSLVRTMLGLVPQTRSAVSVNDHPLTSLDHRQRAAIMAWLPQQLDVSEPVRVSSLVAAARFRFDESRTDCDLAVRRSLAACGVERLTDQRITTLSGGELQRVAIAALLAQEAAFLLLDEPANHLDPGLLMEASALLIRQWQQGRGLIIVTHQLNLVLQAVALEDHSRIRVIGMNAGRIEFDLKLSDPNLVESLNRLYQVEMAEFESHGQRLLVPLFRDALISSLEPQRDGDDPS